MCKTCELLPVVLKKSVVLQSARGKSYGIRECEPQKGGNAWILTVGGHRALNMWGYLHLCR